jgi:hypothetical protein
MNPYIKPLEFDAGGYAWGSGCRYLIQKQTQKDNTIGYRVLFWSNIETLWSAHIGSAQTYDEAIALSNKHNQVWLSLYLTPAGCERLGIDL